MSIYLSIIIPAYNEEARLLISLIPTIAFLKQQDYSSEIIVVSDGSTDKTKQVAESFINEFQNINILEYFPNKGKGYAVKKGMLSAHGEYRLFMDADYAVPIEFIAPFLSMIKNHYDIVIGSRGLRKAQFESHQPFLREFAAKSFGVLQRMVLNLPFHDTQCGFKLFTKDAAEFIFPKISFNCSYFDAELIYIAYHNKMQIGEIGVRWRHDGVTRLPIGIRRTAELIKKLFYIKSLKCN